MANVHAANIDGAFKNAGVEFETIADVRNHEIVNDYLVNAIEISGAQDDEKINLHFTKFSSVGHGHMEIKSMTIPILMNPSYKHATDLRKISDKIREEVALYKEGNFDPIEDEPEESDSEEKPKKPRKQKKLQFEQPADAEGEPLTDEFGGNGDADGGGFDELAAAATKSKIDDSPFDEKVKVK